MTRFERTLTDLADDLPMSVVIPVHPRIKKDLEQLRPMRVLITGSRDWDDYTQIERVLARFEPGTTIVHGGNGRWDRVRRIHVGADRLAGIAGQKLGFQVEVFPAAWSTYGKRAGMIRNQKMVDAGADLVLAFPLESSVGTFDCMRRAERAGITVVRGDQIVFPGD